MGRFDERATQPARGPGDIFRWRVTDALAGRRVKETDPSFTPPRRDPDLELIRSSAPSLTWIGHATFAMRLGGLFIATDPVWSDRLAVIKRKAPPGVALDVLPPIDIVTVTHNHYDHLDAPTIRRIGPKPLYVTPLGNRRWLEAAGAERIVELDWWQSHDVDGVQLTLVPARHWSMRAPWNRNDGLWGGFVYRSREGAAYHSGDTALFDGFAEIAQRCGPIDWAMLPIGAYEPRWFMQPQHMNPEDAGEAFLRLKARHLCAMHWGTFKLTDEPLAEPPARIRAFFAEHRLPDDRLWMFDIGQTRALV
ncbi:MAG TPA: MBL fold metallo-hydrolase [Polyangia bacterium]|jgi:L-ascorbate metabolism protein UlaG (beta-lactamase superfamily)|nr:MBL fold metallo-hydrolase [Polyangia bacterium]